MASLIGYTPGMSHFFFTVLGFVVGGAALYAHRAYLLHQALLEGKRSGLRDAIRIVRDRADVAVRMAPPGELTIGLVRAQVAHSIELELGTVLSEVR